MVFDILDAAATLAVLVVLAAFGLLMRRTLLRRKGASTACALRVDTLLPGRGWHLGVMRYAPADLDWFRLFSPSPHPKLTLRRDGIEITGRREPRGFELHSIPHGAVVIDCAAVTSHGATTHLQLAMGERALTGFLAWLESAAPGAHQRPDVRPV